MKTDAAVESRGVPTSRPVVAEDIQRAKAVASDLDLAICAQLRHSASSPASSGGSSQPTAAVAKAAVSDSCGAPPRLAPCTYSEVGLRCDEMVARLREPQEGGAQALLAPVVELQL